MKHRFILPFVILALLLFFAFSTKTNAEDYTIPAPEAEAMWLGTGEDTYGVLVYWQMPETAEPDEYGFIVEKEKVPPEGGDTIRERAAIIYPKAGFDDLTDGGYYYDEGAGKCETYDYYVQAFDKSNVHSEWKKTNTVTLETPVIQNPAPQDITCYDAVVTWKSDLWKSKGSVEYGLTKDYGMTANSQSSDGKDHRTKLEGLDGNKEYHYRVKAEDYGDTAYTCDRTFTTPYCTAPTPSPRPTISPSISPSTSPIISPIPSPNASPTISPGTSPTTSSTPSPTNSGATPATTCKVESLGNGWARACYYDIPGPYLPYICTSWSQNISSVCSESTCRIAPSLFGYVPCRSGIYNQYGWCECTPSAQSQSTQPLTITADIADGTSSASVEYGIRKDAYSKTVLLTQIEGTTFAAQIPNSKSRTYHYRIVTTDKDGKVTASEDKIIKHGNRFARFFNDAFGNFWGWLTERF